MLQYHDVRSDYGYAASSPRASTISSIENHRRRQPARAAARLCHALWQRTIVSLLVIAYTAHQAACDGRSSPGRPEHAAELLACINQNYTFRVTTWNDSILHDAPPSMKLEKLWWSTRPPRFQFTVLTQLSVDRVSTLITQCAAYAGPLAAAVYLPLVEAPSVSSSNQLSPANQQIVAEHVQRLTRVHGQLEAAGGCQLDMMLLTEVFDTQESTMLYPVNSLRNFARMQVRTQLLSAIDVDMIISSTLSLDLQQPGRVAELEALASSRVATVLPAFEPKRQGPVGQRLADHVANVSKAELETLMERKEVLQFKLKVFPRGHTPTNYTRWFAAQQPYAVAYQRMYEPWFITHWAAMPWFDTNFRGYGLNKIVHVASLNFYNVTFQVHPNAWLVHRPHEDTAVRKVVAREASNVNKLGVRLPKHALYHKVTILFGKAKRAMIRGDYAPRLDDALVRCFKQLTWLQPFVELQGIPVDADVFL